MALPENNSARQRARKNFHLPLHSSDHPSDRLLISDCMCVNTLGTKRPDKPLSCVLRISLATIGDDPTTMSLVPRLSEISGPWFCASWVRVT